MDWSVLYTVISVKKGDNTFQFFGHLGGLFAQVDKEERISLVRSLITMLEKQIEMFEKDGSGEEQ